MCRTLPDSIGNCVALQDMNFFNNRLTKLPATLSNCVSLKDVNVSGNKLKTLPDPSSWGAIERIAAFGNHIVLLPDFAAVASTLLQLQLNDNAIEHFPSFGTEPAVLELCELNINQLHEISADALAPLTSCKNLSVKHNQISVLPAAICGMTALETLNIAKNLLTSFPQELGDCPALKVILAEHNPIGAPPTQLLNLPQLYRVNLKDCGIDLAQPDTRAAMKELDTKCRSTARGGWARY